MDAEKEYVTTHMEKTVHPQNFESHTVTVPTIVMSTSTKRKYQKGHEIKRQLWKLPFQTNPTSSPSRAEC